MIELNLYTDNDLPSYIKFIDKEYLFYNYCNFADNYSTILHFHVNESWNIFLTRVRKLYPDLFWYEGIKPDFYEFKLETMKTSLLISS